MLGKVKNRSANYERDRARRRRAAIREELDRHLDHCQRCGFPDKRALQFHHRDPSTKLFALGSAMQMTIGLETIREEIAKCDVLCCNCHSIHHAEQRELGKALRASRRAHDE